MSNDWKLRVLKHLNDAEMAAIQAISTAPGVNPDQAEDYLRELRQLTDRYRQTINRAAVMLESVAASEELSIDGGSLDEFLTPVPPDIQEPDGSGGETSK